MLENIFKAIVITSLVGAGLTVILALLKPITKRSFSASWHYYIWIAVLVVMILPVRIDLPEKKVEVKPQFYVSETAPDLAILNVDEIATLRVKKATETPDASVIDITAEQAAFLWLAVAVLLLLIKISAYFLCCVRLRRKSKAVECPMLSKLTKRQVAVREGENISSPVMIGLVRPILYLPDIQMNEEQMNFILSHELIHLRRGDIYYKWLAMLIKCIHWFNPAVYYIHRRLDEECEISCDLVATKKADDKEKIRYMETILELLTKGKERIYPLSTGMTGNKKLLKTRFAMLKRNTRAGKIACAVSVITAIAVIVPVICFGGVLSGKYIDEIKPVAVSEQPVELDMQITWPSPHSNNITRKFGWNHTGIDIATPKGLGIIAAIAGEVTDAGFSAKKGNYIVISNGEIKTEYRHLESIGVTVGQKVSEGEMIGASGSTGMATGPHLHFEVTKNGEYVDPEIFADERVYTNEKRVHPFVAGVKEDTETEPTYKGEQRTREYPAKVTTEMLLTATEQVESKAETANLKASYVITEYDMDNGTGAEITVKPDLDGTISLFFETDTQTAVADITIEEKKENGEGWVYYLPTNSSMVYDFCGFESGEEYTIKVDGYYPGNYGINGKILVY